MSKIGSLTAGVGVETVFNLQFLPEFIIVKDLNGGSVTAVSWNIAGKELVNVATLSLVESFSSFKQNITNGSAFLAEIMTTGDGYLPNQQFQLRITNGNAAARDVFAFSRKKGTGRVISAAQVVVVDGANQRFENFLSLIFGSTNVTRVDLTFKNSKSSEVFTDSFTVEELSALFALDNPSLNGRYANNIVIDNTNLLNKIGMYVESATLYCAGGNVNVVVGGLSQL